MKGFSKCKFMQVYFFLCKKNTTVRFILQTYYFIQVIAVLKKCLLCFKLMFPLFILIFVK